VVQSVELKFNCFFLMPVIDTFPTRLREDIESAYIDDLDGVFDVGAVRDALNTRLHALESELHQVLSQFSSPLPASWVYCTTPSPPASMPWSQSCTRGFFSCMSSSVPSDLLHASTSSLPSDLLRASTPWRPRCIR